MSKREVWEGPRIVDFSLSLTTLIVTHYGKIFDERDVRGISGIGVSTKEEELTSIGQFGIGFKSVYAFTRSPEIHSGDEHFAIDNYVLLRVIPATDLQPDSTEIHIPFGNENLDAATHILKGLQQLNLRTLLFLHEIEEISWEYHVEGLSGSYCRESKPLGDSTRSVTIISQDANNEVEEEQWIVFSKAVFNQGEEVGNVEIAFALKGSLDDRDFLIQPVIESHLVVFFPTVRSTSLGFLIQGPYRTTPSRDNVPERVEWNQRLVIETSKLLVDALREFREMGQLNVALLNLLPLDASRFPEGSWLAPLFDAVRNALMNDPLLPCYEGDYAAASNVKLARTQELRDLINSEQLTELFDSDIELRWVSEKITADLTPELVSYMKDQLNVREVTPDNLIASLGTDFLEKQSDEWMERFYIFLNGRGLNFFNKLRDVPLIRLEDGSHTAYDKDKPQAYLPSANSTDYPTVRRSVCQLKDALAFLKSLGLDYPDPVDDVITHVLPRYCQTSPEVTDDDYRSDIERLLDAYDTDSVSQRKKLVCKLSEVKFVRATDVGTGERIFACPGQVYQATQRLKRLFSGVSGILIVDDSLKCLRGENIRSLLEHTGVSRTLSCEEIETTLWHETADLARLRKEQGHSAGRVTPHVLRDHELRGLKPLVELMSSLSTEEASSRAALLWKALCKFQDEHGSDLFNGVYEWKYYAICSTLLDAAFVKLLNEESWVPDGIGTLQRPQLVTFESTGWEENSFLLTKINFKPSIIDELAREVGFEPGVLELLTKRGLTSIEKLREAGISDDESGTERDHLDEEMYETRIVDDDVDVRIDDDPKPEERVREGRIRDSAEARDKIRIEPKPSYEDKLPPGEIEFITYVKVGLGDETEIDTDGLSLHDRLEIEDQAVELILQHEPQLERMPGNNPGYDLRELDSDDRLVRLVEVKAMTGTLHDRTATLSRTQFEYARRHGEKYWLYIVENSTDFDRARILRIQDPYGKAKTFTFDHGWAAVVDTESEIYNPTKRFK